MSGERKTTTGVLQGLRQFKIEERTLPQLEPRQVLIRMKNVGICGSDVHYFAHGKCGDFEIKGPIILGHESSGIVEEVGKLVKNLKVGDRVAIEPGVPCRSCHSCKIGRYNLCKDVQFLATPPIDGSLATFHIHDADFCHKLPDNVSLEEGALVEPLSVGLHAMQRSKINGGDCVLIMGAGPIGLVCLLAARACGAATIIISDINTQRLQVAKELGADLVLAANDPNFIEKIHQEHSVDACFECSGVESAIRLGIKSLKPGGKIVLIGRGPKPELSVPLYHSADLEIDIIGVFRYANVYPSALRMIASGQINVKKLITHHYKLEQMKEAFELAESGADGAIKIMFSIN